MPVAHINIGSNLGDSLSEIEKAVAEIAFHISVAPPRSSNPVYSKSWGYESDNIYTNIGVEIITCLPPEELLERLLEIEHRLSPLPHRDTNGNYIDRLIDIDLIYYENCIIDSPTLKLPHPRMHLREFVLRPVAELAPYWCHPITGKTASQMLEQLDNTQ